MSGGKQSSSATRAFLTERALSDLDGIERYSNKQWGRKVADRYLGDIAAALDRIRAKPAILRLEPKFATGLYFYRVNKHVLACDVSDQLVIVFTVIHTSMDIPMRLQELEPRLLAEIEFLRNKLRRHNG